MKPTEVFICDGFVSFPLHFL